MELGVFKGTDVAIFIKFLEIYFPNSNKKVIRFDIFNPENKIIDTFENGHTMKIVYNKTKKNDLSLECVTDKLVNINNGKSKFILVEGDVCITTKTFVKENPGFRISLLYIDLDLNEPVYESLKNLWNRILPGGYIIFDEYEYHKFDESNGVDRFLKHFNLEYNVISTNFMTPSAYLIKKINNTI